MFEIIRDMPGRKSVKDRRSVKFELSAANIEYLQSRLPDLVWGPEFDDRIADIANQRAVEQRTRELKHLPTEAFHFDFKTEPFEHQRKAFFISRDLKVFGFFMEMGTGKSKVLLDTAAHLWAAGKINALLILAPNGVHRQWANEQIPTHLPDWVPRQVLAHKAGAPATVLRRIRELAQFDGLRIMTQNIESLSVKSGVIYATEFLRTANAMVAIDESTRIKSPGAKRTKAAQTLGDYAEYRRILTGSPITKGVEDLYAQLRFLDPDVLGFNSYYTFRNRFCIMGGYENKAVVAYRNTDELVKKLEGISFRVLKRECLDLPDKIYETRPVILSPEQRVLYDKMKKELKVSLEGKLIEAPLAIVKLVRLQQIISGFLPDPKNPEIKLRIPGANTRLEVLKEILEECQGKTIVWSRFVEDIEFLGKELRKYDPVLFYGQMAEDEDKALKRFKENPHCTLLIGTPQKGGIGLNLTVASNVVYYANGFNAELRWQSEDRCHRIGQTNKVTYFDLVAEKTIDNNIVRALRKKKNVADSVVDAEELLIDDEDELESLIVDARSQTSAVEDQVLQLAENALLRTGSPV